MKSERYLIFFLNVDDVLILNLTIVKKTLFL